SMLYKSYAIPEDQDDEHDDDAGLIRKSPAGSSGKARYHIRRPRRQARSKSYRMPSSGAQESARELSSKFKSACRKLDPRRLAKTSHHHSRAGTPPSPISGDEAGPADIQL
ncbi:hypothetical protein H4S02_000595, partial [Coemansia sp. RSA 2611]